MHMRTQENTRMSDDPLKALAEEVYEKFVKPELERLSASPYEHDESVRIGYGRDAAGTDFVSAVAEGSYWQKIDEYYDQSADWLWECCDNAAAGAISDALSDKGAAALIEAWIEKNGSDEDPDDIAETLKDDYLREMARDDGLDGLEIVNWNIEGSCEAIWRKSYSLPSELILEKSADAAGSAPDFLALPDFAGGDWMDFLSLAGANPAAFARACSALAKQAAMNIADYEFDSEDEKLEAIEILSAWVGAVPDETSEADPETWPELLIGGFEPRHALYAWAPACPQNMPEELSRILCEAGTDDFEAEINTGICGGDLEEHGLMSDTRRFLFGEEALNDKLACSFERIWLNGEQLDVSSEALVSASDLSWQDNSADDETLAPADAKARRAALDMQRSYHEILAPAGGGADKKADIFIAQAEKMALAEPRLAAAALSLAPEARKIAQEGQANAQAMERVADALFRISEKLPPAQAPLFTQGGPALPLPPKLSVEALLEAPSRSRLPFGSTLLHAACHAMDADLANRCLDAGMDPFEPNEFGAAPVQLLLERASWQKPDFEKKLAFLVRAVSENPEKANALRIGGLGMLAFAWDRSLGAKGLAALCKAGLDPSAPDGGGKSLIDRVWSQTDKAAYEKAYLDGLTEKSAAPKKSMAL